MGSSLYRNYSTGRGSPYMEKTFKVQDIRRWAALIRDRKGEESQHVASMIYFLLNFWNKLVLACIFM